jgi:hypothetical protein
MSERRIGGAELRLGRELQLRDALAICGFFVGAAAIGAALSPLAILCALLVIVVETARLFFESERRPSKKGLGVTGPAEQASRTLPPA